MNKTQEHDIDLDIIEITDVCDAEFGINGYTVIQKDRVGQRGGRMILYPICSGTYGKYCRLEYICMILTRDLIFCKPSSPKTRFKVRQYKMGITRKDTG